MVCRKAILKVYAIEQLVGYHNYVPAFAARLTPAFAALATTERRKRNVKLEKEVIAREMIDIHYIGRHQCMFLVSPLIGDYLPNSTILTHVFVTCVCNEYGA